MCGSVRCTTCAFQPQTVALLLISGGEHGLDQRYQCGFGNIDGRVRPNNSRDFVGSERLKPHLCTLPYVVFSITYEKILMRMNVTADRSYAEPRHERKTCRGFQFRTLDVGRKYAISLAIHGITAPLECYVSSPSWLPPAGVFAFSTLDAELSETKAR
mgnify:CR=1 FL=1